MSLRQKFKHSDDPADDKEPVEGVDEQEQETIIQELADRDKASNEYFRIAFMTLPMIGLLYYLCMFFYFTGYGHASFTSFPLFYSTCLWSLALSFTMVYDTRSLDLEKHSMKVASTKISADTAVKLANLLCVAVAAIMANVIYDDSQTGETPLWLAVLPAGLIFCLTFVGSFELRATDLEPLQKLKYGYKGA